MANEEMSDAERAYREAVAELRADIDKLIEDALVKLRGVLADSEDRMQAALARIEPPPTPSVN